MSKLENELTGTLWGQEWPLDYGDLSQEYKTLKEGSSAQKLEGMGWLALAGPDGGSFLNALLTPDFRLLTEGETTEAWALDSQGKILYHLQVYRQAGGFLLQTTSDQLVALHKHLEKYLIMEDAQLSRKQGIVIYTLQGATATEQLAALALPETVGVHTMDRCGLGGYDLLTTEEHEGSLLDRLAAAGLGRVGFSALAMTRTEAFKPSFGRDMVAANNPLLYGKGGSRISYTKGCFLGQETVARARDRGHPPRLLVLLKAEGSQQPTQGEALLSDNKPVGLVTSATWSPKYQATLAFALVKYGVAIMGASFKSEQGRDWRAIQISIYRD